MLPTGGPTESRFQSLKRRQLRVESLESRHLLAAAPTITEFLADNGDSLHDGNGNSSDWIEFHNAGDEAIDLLGWYVTDDARDLAKWRFPSFSLEPNEYKILFASGQGPGNAVDSAGNLHTNFRLSADDGYLALVGADGETVVVDFGFGGTTYPPQIEDVSYGIPFAGGVAKYFTTPTPGQANRTEAFDGFVADTEFSVDRGIFAPTTAAFEVEISTTTSEATIVYTLDGSKPDVDGSGSPTNGAPYTSPISVQGTTTLRAAAFKPGFIPTNVDTQTYIFIDDVLTQPATIPGYPRPVMELRGTGFNVPLDYEVDSRVVNDPAYHDDLITGLTAIPTISIVMDVDDFLGPNGFYDKGGSGLNAPWQRPASVELIDPRDPSSNFQIDAGVQPHTHRHIKRSIRLSFKREFGPAKLQSEIFRNAPLNGDSATDVFDRIVLRAGYNRAFLYSNPDNSSYLRDQWHRDTEIAMRGYGSHGTFAHLYINGLYFGLYNPVERPDAWFTSEYFGGDVENWYAFNHGPFGSGGAAISGDPARFNYLTRTLINEDLRDATKYDELRQYLDVEQFADYLILNWYGHNIDWPHNNFYGGNRNGDDPSPLLYFSWDAEGILSGASPGAWVPPGFRFGANANTTIERIWHSVRKNVDFMALFADRVHAHTSHGGALTAEKAIERWDTLSDFIRDAIIGESARWGDARDPVDGRLRTRATWEADGARVRQHLQGNTETLIEALRDEGFYGLVEPPEFSQRGGDILPGFQLTLNTVADQIYFTIDGTDPRLRGGGINPNAIAYESPIHLTETTYVNARVLSRRGWSPLEQAIFTVNTPIQITEIHYNPAAPSVNELAAGFSDKDDFEFIELYNGGGEDLNLIGLQFSAGIEFDFPPISIAAGDYAVVVQNEEAFRFRYGDDASVVVLGEFSSGGLSNGGERLRLDDAQGATILDFAYGDSDPWPERADGSGASLELVDTDTPVEELGKHYRWRGSTEFGGSPGRAGIEPMGVVVNEVLANTDAPTTDAIELHNPTDRDMDISGWFLSDSDNDLLKFAIPDRTVLQPGSYVVFDENDFNPNPAEPGPQDFALDGANGDDVWLVISDGAGSVAQFVDDIHFGATTSGETLGRSPNGSGRLAPLGRDTLGCGNWHPRVGPLVLSEIHYNPGEPSAAALAIQSSLDSSDLEFVEIHNPTGQDVSLANWRLRGGVDYDFASDSILAAGETLIVISFNPASIANADRLSAFAAHFGLGLELDRVEIVGGWSGQLSDSGEVVRLERPDQPPPEAPLLTPHVTEDEVLYDDLTPWAAAADGTGSSLHRVAPVFFGNATNSWHGADPTPGQVDFSANLPGDLDGDKSLTADDIDILFDAVHSDSTVSYLDLDGSHTVDSADVTFLVENLLGTSPGDANLDGRVDAADLNQVGLHWLQSGCVSWSSGNLNGDGRVNPGDLNVIGLNWLRGVPAAIAGGGDRTPRAALARQEGAVKPAAEHWRRSHDLLENVAAVDHVLASIMHDGSGHERSFNVVPWRARPRPSALRHTHRADREAVWGSTDPSSDVLNALLQELRFP